MPNPFPLLATCCIVPTSVLAQGFSHGTAIAITRSDSQIIIATDSRMVNSNQQVLENVCKISSAGKWYFSGNGMWSSDGLDVRSLVRKILLEDRALPQHLNAIADALTPPLNTAMRSNVTVRDHVTAGGGGVLGIIVFGREQGSLKLGYLKFTLSNKVSIVGDSFICPGMCADGRAGVFVPASDTSRFDWSTPASTAVRAFVQMEIERKRNDIGPPIQMLSIDSSGHSGWIEKPDFCKEEK